MEVKKRTMEKGCGWEVKNELYEKYHNEEWGTPLHDDNKLFEFLTLESFQAGLNWLMILKKRENFSGKAFANFIPTEVAKIWGKRSGRINAGHWDLIRKPAEN